MASAWQEKFDNKSGRTYYVNTETRERTWNKPSADETTQQDAAAVNTDNSDVPSPWVMKTDPKSNRTYYVNSVTKERSWKKPFGGTSTVSSPINTDSSDLPSPWVMKTDPRSNRAYYVNSVTKERSWNKPFGGTSTVSSPSNVDSSDLPSPWVMKTDPKSNRAYYVNSVTKERTWKKPFGGTSTVLSPSNVDSSDLPSPWVMKTDPRSNRAYYVNSVTKERTWTRPFGGTSTTLKTSSRNENTDLPAPWIMKTDPKSNRAYYVNSVTKERTWNRPQPLGDTSTELKTSSRNENTDLPAPWVMKTDPKSNRTYYVNPVTKERSWTKPAPLTPSRTSPSPSPSSPAASPLSPSANPTSPSADPASRAATPASRAASPANPSTPSADPASRSTSPANPSTPSANPSTPSASPSTPSARSDEDEKDKKSEEDERRSPEEEQKKKEEEEEERVKKEEEEEENQKKKAEEEEEERKRRAEEEERERLLKERRITDDAERRNEDRVRYDWDDEAGDEGDAEEGGEERADANVFESLAALNEEVDEGADEGGETIELAAVAVGEPAVVPRYIVERRTRALKGAVVDRGEQHTEGQGGDKDNASEPTVFGGARAELGLHSILDLWKVQNPALFVKSNQLYVPLTYRTMPYDLRFNYVGFTFSRYARKNFDYNTPHSFLHSTKELAHPLLRKLNPDLKKDATDFFKTLKSFVAGQNDSRAQLAQAITSVRDKDAPTLSTEVYCQIIRQLRGCPDVKQAESYWQALVCCLSNFLPSDGFELPLLNFLAAVIERTALNDIEADLIERADRRKRRRRKKAGGAATAQKPAATANTDSKKFGPPAGKDPTEAWKRRAESPLVKREAILYAQFAFFLFLEGRTRKNNNASVNAQGTFDQGDVDRVVNLFANLNGFECTVSESVFLQGMVDPSKFASYYQPQVLCPPSLYHPLNNPLSLESLSDSPQLTVPYGPDTQQTYGIHLAEVPLPWHLLFLTWRLKATHGPRVKKIFLHSVENADDGKVQELVEHFRGVDFNGAKQVVCPDAHVYAAVLLKWVYELPIPVLSYTEELDALLKRAPYKHPSNLDNKTAVSYTSPQLECATFCETHTDSLLLIVLKYLIRFFRIFLEPQFSYKNRLSVQTLSTCLAGWLFGQSDEMEGGSDEEEQLDEKSEGKDGSQEEGEDVSNYRESVKKEARTKSRSREQKKAIYVLNLLHTLQPTETEEELFASLDDYMRQFDKM